MSANDLPHIIADSCNSGDLPVELSLMMDRILDFPQRDVEHAMLPRFQVDWLSPTTTIGELRKMMAVETVSGMLIAELGALPAKGHSVTILLPVDPADLVADVPIQRKLVVDILEVERYVPTQVRVWLVEEVMSEEPR